MKTWIQYGLAGVAMLVTLLLSNALGTTWVDVEGGVTPGQAAGMTTSVPDVPGRVVGTGHGVMPQPPLPGFLPLPFNYVYLDPDFYSLNEYPWYAPLSGMREQHLYLAGEIGRGGTIDQIALFKTHYDYAATFPNVSVKMCNTNVTSLSSNFADNYGGRTPVWVFHQDSGFVRGGEADVWDAVDLQTPFDYNGTDNLLVEVVWHGTASGFYAYSWYSNAFAGNRRAGFYNPFGEPLDTLVAGAYFIDGCFYNTRIGFRGEPDDVGVLDILSPHDLVGFGDTIFPRGRVTNCGSQAQVDIPVTFVIYDSATGARVYAETVYVARLDTGEVRTVAFPSWVPPVEDKVYFDTMATALPGDDYPANDWKAGRFAVAAWAEGRMTYNDGACGGYGYTWTSPNYTLGVRFPGPCPVTKLAIGLTGYSNDPGGPYPCTCKVRLNDGTDNMPGTVVWSSPMMLRSAGYPNDYINYIALDPPADVTSDSFYVTWKPQQVANPFLCADTDEPLQVGNDFGTIPGAEVFHPLALGPETDSSADLLIDAYSYGPVLDGTPEEIASPREQLDSGTTFIPQVMVKNAGLLDRDNIMATFRIVRYLGGDSLEFYSGVANSGPIRAGETRTAAFADSVTLHVGNYTMTSVTWLLHDGRPANDTLVRPLSVGLGIADVNLVPGRASVSIAPNPLARTATVRYSLPEPGLVTFSVYDVTGRVVLSRKIAAKRVGAEALDLRELEAGVYIVKVRADGFSTTQKLVVQRQ